MRTLFNFCFALSIFVCIVVGDDSAEEEDLFLDEEFNIDAAVVKEVLKRLDVDEDGAIAKGNETDDGGRTLTDADLDREIEEVLLSLIIERNKRVHKKRIHELLDFLRAADEKETKPLDDDIPALLTAESDNFTDSDFLTNNSTNVGAVGSINVGADCTNVDDIFFPTDNPLIVTAIQNAKLNLPGQNLPKSEMSLARPKRAAKKQKPQNKPKAQHKPKPKPRPKKIRRAAVRAAVRAARKGRKSAFKHKKSAARRHEILSWYGTRRLTLGLRTSFNHQRWQSRKERLVAVQKLIRDSLSSRSLAPHAWQIKRIQIGKWGTIDDLLKC